MSRRKTVPDDLLLDRLMAPMMAHGPADLSFAKASKAVGLAAATLAFLLRLTNSGAAEYDFADGLLLLREGMRNPVLRRRGAEWGARLAEALGRRLGDDADQAAQLGWQMASLWQGTLLWWAFQRDAAPEAKVREALKTWSRTVGVL